MRRRKKRIWVATYGGGLALFDRHTQAFSHYLHDPNDSNSLSNNNIWVLLDIRCSNQTRLLAYPHVLDKIIAELIQNSVTHAFGDVLGAQITTVVQSVGNNMVIQYCDNGVGLEQQALNHIFEPFYTTKRGSECTGLGMLIVYNLVVHQLNNGLTVTLTMPNTL